MGRLDKIRRQAARDRSFRNRLLSDPATTLITAGVPVPPGVAVHVVASTTDTYYLAIPPFVGDPVGGDETEGTGDTSSPIEWWPW